MQGFLMKVPGSCVLKEKATAMQVNNTCMSSINKNGNCGGITTSTESGGRSYFLLSFRACQHAENFLILSGEASLFLLTFL